MTAQVCKRVLVTGGTGFLGSYVARKFAARGAEVRILGRRSPKTLDETAAARLHFVQGDVLDSTLANSNVFSGLDLVVHAAAHIRANDIDERVIQRKVNVDGTRNVIAACHAHGVKRLVHVSSCAAIGIPEAESEPADENFEFNLAHLDQGYNLTKLAAERIVLAANSASFETVVVNPGFIFGWEGTAFRGHEVIDRVLQRPVVLCTDGGLSIVHVEDVVAGILCAAEVGHPGERYILSGQNVSFREIAEIVSQLSGRKRVVVSVPRDFTRMIGAVLRRMPLGAAAAIGARLTHLDRYSHQHYSSSKAQRELKYVARSFAQIAEEALHPPR